MRSCPSLFVLATVTALAACAVEPAASDETSSAASGVTESNLGITDPGLAALVRADRAALDQTLAAGNATPTDPAPAPASAQADNASSRTYAWHVGDSTTFVNNAAAYAWGYNAIQTAYDNGRATYVRSYGSIHCYAWVSTSGGHWTHHACTVDNAVLSLVYGRQGTLNDEHPYYDNWSLSTTGSDGFGNHYGGWHASHCDDYWTGSCIYALGLMGEWYYNLHNDGDAIYRPSSDC